MNFKLELLADMTKKMCDSMTHQRGANILTRLQYDSNDTKTSTKSDANDFAGSGESKPIDMYLSSFSAKDSHT